MKQLKENDFMEVSIVKIKINKPYKPTFKVRTLKVKAIKNNIVCTKNSVFDLDKLNSFEKGWNGEYFVAIIGDKKTAIKASTIMFNNFMQDLKKSLGSFADAIRVSRDSFYWGSFK